MHPHSEHFRAVVLSPCQYSLERWDKSLALKQEFGDEPFYMVVQTNAAGYFYVAEYYPAQSGCTPEWLIYRYYLAHAGSWTLGPFHPESSEPMGKHTWGLWLYSSGRWAQGTASFSYQPYYRSTGTPSVAGLEAWGPVQVIIVAILMGALGVTVGMLIANRRRYEG